MNNAIEVKVSVRDKPNRFNPNFTDFAKTRVGNIEINGCNLAPYLKKSHYWLNFDRRDGVISFWANEGKGGEVLFKIFGAFYENAVKLAEMLDLKIRDTEGCLWAKYES